MIRRFLFLYALLTTAGALCAACAQGGPPFITDDPGTPGAGHWEINLGWTGEHHAGSGDYELPNLDMNYGWGDRLQLKFDVPLAAATDENNTTRLGLGDSLAGIKWRPYEHHRAGETPTDENMNFSLGFYPQVLVSNPTASVRRGVVDPGPQYYFPIEFTTRFGPIAFNGELGRWIGNRHVPDRWGRGLIVGHAFSDRFELYGEIYDLTDIDHAADESAQRSETLDCGLRRTLDHAGHLRLLLMSGRSLHHARAANDEPNWIAYAGLQFRFGGHDEPGHLP
jgi:hypothetical protein